MSLETKQSEINTMDDDYIIINQTDQNIFNNMNSDIIKQIEQITNQNNNMVCDDNIIENTISDSDNMICDNMICDNNSVYNNLVYDDNLIYDDNITDNNDVMNYYNNKLATINENIFDDTESDNITSSED